ncbi:hypothetical protein R3J32_04390 [Xylella fastidiosa subsp. multiplex]|uniref:hypothetical protein n=1 Tax=Xylella fastidiosa TaxID=2371 RepID=UPI0035D3FD48
MLFPVTAIPYIAASLLTCRAGSAVAEPALQKVTERLLGLPFFAGDPRQCLFKDRLSGIGCIVTTARVM